MSISLTYAATATVEETLETNVDSLGATTARQITHNAFNESAALTASTTPPVTKVACFIATLSGGALTINLASLTGTNGATVDMTGLKVQVLRVKNLGANNLTIVPGGSNGIDLFGVSSSVTVYPSGHVMFYFNDASPDVASGDRTLDLTGTTTQTSEWTIVAG